MAKAYLKVLNTLKEKIIVVGRDATKVDTLAKQYGGVGYGGGIKALEKINCGEIELAIIASSIDSLAENTIGCLQHGICKVLVEKPGGLDLSELYQVKNKLSDSTILRFAHNRRHYASVKTLKKRLENEKIEGCFFDFTELSEFLRLNRPASIIQRWGFANSIHVIDTTFYLIGSPLEIKCLRSGGFEKHNSGSTFAGSGRTQNCLFSYLATWGGGGRWNIEVATNKGRYKLSPMECLQFCKKDQFKWEDIEIDYSKDINFKPGLMDMVSSMLRDTDKILPTIEDQIKLCTTIDTMLGYK